jgi:DNA-binding response OmpR family regulator
VTSSGEVSGEPVPSPSPLCVLVVEDDPDTSAMLGVFLESRGYRYVIAHDAHAALAALRESTPDVALIDIGLPTKSGLQLAKEIRSTVGPAIRLIATTGYTSDADRTRALAFGFDALLAKPLDFDELITQVGAGRHTPD